MSSRPPSARLLAAVAAVTLAVAGVASAKSKPPPSPPPDVSAVNGYVESVPTAGGSEAVGVGNETKKPLPPEVEQQVRKKGGKDAGALEEIATSSQYGAPTQTLPASTQSTPTTPAATQPVQTQPVQTQPVHTQPVQTQPVQTTPGSTPTPTGSRTTPQAQHPVRPEPQPAPKPSKPTFGKGLSDAAATLSTSGRPTGLVTAMVAITLAAFGLAFVRRRGGRPATATEEDTLV